MALSTCPHCVRYYVTEEGKKPRCPDCGKKLKAASPEEWQQRQSPGKTPQTGTERTRRAPGP